MRIDEHVISKLENLARLALSPEERDALREDLDNILAMVRKLQSLDTEGVEPLVYVNEAATDALREDCVKGQASREEALRNAPDSDGVFFRAPKVIDL
jgi:aspartyl-tRNA(Asn)/glutamyl-tRNA(Gln) amidotransferase subunit C